MPLPKPGGFIEVEEPALAPSLPPVGAFAAAAAFTVTRPSAAANDSRDRRLARARVVVDRARPRLISSPSQLEIEQTLGYLESAIGAWLPICLPVRSLA